MLGAYGVYARRTTEVGRARSLGARSKVQLAYFESWSRARKGLGQAGHSTSGRKSMLRGERVRLCGTSMSCSSRTRWSAPSAQAKRKGAGRGTHPNPPPPPRRPARAPGLLSAKEGNCFLGSPRLVLTGRKERQYVSQGCGTLVGFKSRATRHCGDPPIRRTMRQPATSEVQCLPCPNGTVSQAMMPRPAHWTTHHLGRGPNPCFDTYPNGTFWV